MYSATVHRPAVKILVRILKFFFQIIIWICVAWFSPIYFLWFFLQKFGNWINQFNGDIYLFVSPLRAVLIIIGGLFTLAFAAYPGSLCAIIFKKEYMLWWMIDCILIGGSMFPAFGLAAEKLTKYTSVFYYFDPWNDAFSIFYEVLHLFGILIIAIGQVQFKPFLQELRAVPGGTNSVTQVVQKHIKLTIANTKSIVILFCVSLVVAILLVAQLLKLLGWAVTRYDAYTASFNATVVQATVQSSTQYTFWSTVITISVIAVSSAIFFKPAFLIQMLENEKLAKFLTAFKLIFISYTINELPSLVKRVKSVQQYESEQNAKYAALRCLPRPNVKNEYNGQILPEEMLQKIFVYLGGQQVAKNAMPVCKQWYNVTKVELFWKELADGLQKTQAPKATRIQAKKIIRNPVGVFPVAKHYIELYSYIHKSEPAKVEYISHYITKYKTRSATISDKDIQRLDYHRGYQTVIHMEFIQAIWNILFFFALPLKALYFFAFPFYWYNSFRASLVHMNTINYNYPLYSLHRSAIEFHNDAGKRKGSWTYLHTFTVFSIVSTLLWTLCDIVGIYTDFWVLVFYAGVLKFQPIWLPNYSAAVTTNQKVSMFLSGILIAIAVISIFVAPIYLPMRVVFFEILSYPIFIVSYCFDWYSAGVARLFDGLSTLSYIVFWPYLLLVQLYFVPFKLVGTILSYLFVWNGVVSKIVFHAAYVILHFVGQISSYDAVYYAVPSYKYFIEQFLLIGELLLYQFVNVLTYLTQVFNPNNFITECLLAGLVILFSLSPLVANYFVWIHSLWLPALFATCLLYSVLLGAVALPRKYYMAWDSLYVSNIQQPLYQHHGFYVGAFLQV